jgi:glycerophosphoryl diester phosphodiesterase
MKNIPRKALKIAHEPLKVAHRGFHQMHIENTMEAFRAAYAAGCDMVEFDVQLSRDGIPFIFHDDDCLRLIGRVEQACALTWQELQSLSMPLDSSRKHATQAKGVYKIPSLEEFLGEFGQRAFYLELKVPESKNKDTDYLDILGQTSARLVQAAGPHPDTFLGSFHTGLLCRLAKQHAYPRLAGIFDSYANFQAVHSGTDHETATAIQFYSISAEIFQKFLQKAQSNSQPPGMDKILIWDINGEKSFSQARELGVMGLVTDDIETLLAL